MDNETLTVELFERLNGIFRKYIHFEDPAYYPLSSVYVLFTHLYDVFDQVPYLSVSGLKNSGKSLLGDLFTGLCFNATNSSDYTDASLYRLIDNGRMTLVFDEAEVLSYVKRATLLSILRSGYRRNGKVVRCDHGGAREFPTFCPKIVINEGGIMDAALESRTIPIPMVRSDNHHERFRSARAEAEFGEARRLIGLFADAFRPAVSERYSSFPEVEGLANRDEEVWAPIVIVAELLDSMLPQPTTRSQIAGLTRKVVEQRRRNQLIDDRDARVLEATRAFVAQTEPLRQDGEELYVGDQMCGFIKDRWSIPALNLDQVARILNRHGIVKSASRRRLTISNGDRRQMSCYSLDSERLSRLTEEYYEEEAI